MRAWRWLMFDFCSIYADCHIMVPGWNVDEQPARLKAQTNVCTRNVSPPQFATCRPLPAPSHRRPDPLPPSLPVPLPPCCTLPSPSLSLAPMPACWCVRWRAPSCCLSSRVKTAAHWSWRSEMQRCGISTRDHPMLRCTGLLSHTVLLRCCVTQTPPSMHSCDGGARLAGSLRRLRFLQLLVVCYEKHAFNICSVCICWGHCKCSSPPTPLAPTFHCIPDNVQGLEFNDCYLVSLVLLSHKNGPQPRRR